MAHCNHASLQHACGDIEPQMFLGHDIDPLGSRDIISYMAVGLTVWDAL